MRPTGRHPRQCSYRRCAGTRATDCYGGGPPRSSATTCNAFSIAASSVPRPLPCSAPSFDPAIKPLKETTHMRRRVFRWRGKRRTQSAVPGPDQGLLPRTKSPPRLSFSVQDNARCAWCRFATRASCNAGSRTLNNHAGGASRRMRSKNPRCSVAQRSLGSQNVSARAWPGEFPEGETTIGACVNGPQQSAIPRGSTHKKSRRHDCRRLRYLRPKGRPLTRYELVSASALASGWALPCPLPALSSPSPPPTLSSSTSKISVSFGPIWAPAPRSP